MDQPNGKPTDRKIGFGQQREQKPSRQQGENRRRSLSLDADVVDRLSAAADHLGMRRTDLAEALITGQFQDHRAHFAAMVLQVSMESGNVTEETARKLGRLAIRLLRPGKSR